MYRRIKPPIIVDKRGPNINVFAAQKTTGVFWAQRADNFDAKIFHLHTPKAAGCSVVSDLSSLVGRKNIYSGDSAMKQGWDTW